MHCVSLIFVTMTWVLADGKLMAAGSFFMAADPGEGPAFDNNNLVLEEAFFKCDGNEACANVARSRKSDVAETTEQKPDAKQVGERAVVYERQFPKEGCWKMYKVGFRDDGICQDWQFPVYCKMSGRVNWWIRFQRRNNAALHFNQTFDKYRSGFGDLATNFWLGLEKLHHLAPPGSKTTLRVKVKHASLGSKALVATYKDFWVSGESDGYRLRLGRYIKGYYPAGNALSFHNGSRFSTYHKTVDGEQVGGWWGIGRANLNALYPKNGEKNSQFMTWFDLTDEFGGITFSDMSLTHL